MSGRKRPSDWLGSLTGTNTASNKRAKTPVPQASSSGTSPPPCQATSLLNSTITPPNPSKPEKSAGITGKSAGYAVLSTLKASMKLLEGSCRAFAPLRSAAKDMLKVLESVEKSTQGDPDIFEMASELPQWVLVLSTYLSGPRSDMGESSQLAEQLATELKRQIVRLKAHEERGTFRKRLEAGEKVEELRIFYHRIETSFRQLQAYTTFNSWKITREHFQSSQLEAMVPSHDARYDSSFAHKVKRHGCLKNTRATVLEDLHRWIYGVGGARIFWLNGMAGTGKTTIAYTICSELEQNHRIGGSFFCSRATSDCRDITKILPTIAYQLAQQFYPFRSALCKTLGALPNIAQRELQAQFTYLIKEPLLEMKEMLPIGVVVVIDALDECSDPEATQTILNLLFQDIMQLPIRLLLASRPEPVILNTILNRELGFRSIFHLHNVEWQIVNGDIETYLNVSLATVLEPPQIKQIAERAGVLFIYATTVVRYIQLGRAGANQQARIRAVLNEDAGDKATNKYREIDTLYTTVLNEVLNAELDPLEQSEIDLIKHVLWVVTTARELMTRTTLAGLLMADIEDVSVALEPLRSVLNVVEGSDVVSTLHASFPEFILSPGRSGEWSCRDNKFIATQCFSIMQNQLRFNICNLETSFRFDQEVPDLQVRVANAISSELFYACRYWSEHLQRSVAWDGLLSCLDDFLSVRLLFWMEVLNLKGVIHIGESALSQVNSWLLSQGSETSEIAEFAQHACQFMNVFATHSVRQSTPHIYISCLPLAPKTSKLWNIYRTRFPNVLRLGGSAGEQWYGMTSANQFEAFSAIFALALDGMSIARPSRDGRIQIWGSCDGTLLNNQFESHGTIVSSLTFSPDGSRIASGCQDKTIRVWDSRAGSMLVVPLTGHASAVTSVAFSPDGIRIVSGSWDGTARVWDAFKGNPLASPFRIHTNMVASVTFSPDGGWVASGSLDSTVRVWNPCGSATFVKSLTGHTGGVTSVAYSPDGTRIISGSHDKTIRMWDSHHGAALIHPFVGHIGMVTAVAFSPDGLLIVSGSEDKTVQVWNSHDGTLFARPFTDHTGVVTAVAFSPDGTWVASGSCDGTVRTWNPIPLTSSFKSHVITTAPKALPACSSSFLPTSNLLGPHQNANSCCGSLKYLDHEGCSVDDHGWVQDLSQNKIFWLPRQLHDVFPFTSNQLVIKDTSLTVCFAHLVLGKEWCKCHDSSAK